MLLKVPFIMLYSHDVIVILIFASDWFWNLVGCGRIRVNYIALVHLQTLTVSLCFIYRYKNIKVVSTLQSSLSNNPYTACSYTSMKFFLNDIYHCSND